MVTVADALVVLYPAAVPAIDYAVVAQADGTQALALWNKALGPQPTADQLAAVTDAQVAAAAAAREPDLSALKAQATQALADIATYLGLASPTAAQTQAEVARIDRRQQYVIKALLRLIQLERG